MAIYLIGSIKAEDPIRIPSSVMIKRHSNSLRADRQPFLFRFWINLKNMCFGCENRLIPVNKITIKYQVTLFKSHCQLNFENQFMLSTSSCVCA